MKLRHFNSTRHSLQLAIALTSLVAGQAATAAVITWNGNTDALWATTTNWSSDPNPVPGTGDTAVFNSAGGLLDTISLAGVTINSILFNSANAAAYTLGSGALNSQTLTLDNGGTVTVDSNVIYNQLFNAATILGNDGTTQAFTLTNNSLVGSLTFAGTLTGSTGAGVKTLAVAGAGATTLSGIIADGATGTVELTKTGTGKLTLSAANTYTGVTTLNAGVLRATSQANALGTGAATLTLAGGTLQLANDGGLNFARNTTVSANTVISSDRLTLGAGQTHTLGTLAIGNQTLSVARGAFVNSGTAGLTFGAVTLSAAPTLSLGYGTLLTLGAITDAGNTLTLQGGGNLAQSTAWASGTAGGLTLDTSYRGTTTLNQANTFTGKVTIKNGTLAANTNAAALGAGSLDLQGGILDLNNSAGLAFNQNTTVNANALIVAEKNAAGAGVTYSLGTLNMNGAYTLAVRGGNVNSGTAGLTFGATTLNGNSTLDTWNPTVGSSASAISGNVLLTLGAVTGNGYSLTKNGSGTLQSAEITGTPFGDGNLILNGGTLSLTPGTSGASAVSGVSALAGSTFTYRSGTLQLTKNGTSLDYTLGNIGASADSVLVRDVRGTLVLGVTALANLGTTERLLVNAQTTASNKDGNVSAFGIYDASVVGQEGTGNTGVGSFLLADSVANGGFKLATYTTAVTGTAIAANTISDVTSSIAINDLSNPYALRVGAFTLTNSGTTTVNGGSASATNSGLGGIILNPTATASTITGGVLAFGASEGTVYVGSGAGNATIASQITGAAGLTKFGPGQLALTSNSNNYTGGTTINGGTLWITNEAQLGTAATIRINGGGTLLLGDAGNTPSLASGRDIVVGPGIQNIVKWTRKSATINGIISGSGGVNFGDNTAWNGDGGGGGRLTLAAANIYTGDTILTYTGTKDPGIVVNNNLALQFSTLDYNLTNIPNGINAGSMVIWGAANPILGGLKGNRDWNMSYQSSEASLSIGNNNQDTIYSGILSSSNAATKLIKIGTGTLVLSGNNTYAGVTEVQNGTLVLSGANTGSGNALVSGGTLLVANNLALQNSTFDTASAGTLAFSAGIDTPTLGGLTGSGNLTLPANITSLTLNPASGLIKTYTGNLSGGTDMALTKNGAGSQILGGINSYGGATVVNGGLLQFNSLAAIAGSGRNITLNNGGAIGLGYVPLGSTQNDLLSRIVPTATGAVALTADSAENLDFSSAGANLTAAFLTAASTTTSYVNYTGTLTPNVNYRLGNGGNTGLATALVMPKNFALTGASALIVGGLTAPANAQVILTGANDFAGGTTIGAAASGTRTLLLIGNNSALGTGTLTFLNPNGGDNAYQWGLGGVNGDRMLSNKVVLTQDRTALVTYIGPNTGGAMVVAGATVTNGAYGVGLPHSQAAAVRANIFIGDISGTGSFKEDGNASGISYLSSLVNPTGVDKTFVGNMLAGNSFSMAFDSDRSFGATGTKSIEVNNGLILQPGTPATVTLAAARSITKNTPFVIPGSVTGGLIGNSTLDILGPVTGSPASLNGMGTLNLKPVASDTLATAFAVNFGTLGLDFANTGTDAINLVNATVGLTLNAGTLAVTGKPANTNSQTFTTLALTGGRTNALTLTPGTALTVTLTGSITRSAGSTLGITLNGGTLTASTTPATSNGVIVSAASNGIAYATVGGNGWASLSGNNVVALAAYDAASTAPFTSANNIDMDASAAPVTTSTINSLRFNNVGAVLTLTDSNTISSGGLLVTAAGTGTSITGGTLVPGGGKELVIINNGSLQIDSILGNNATSAVSYSGSGTTTLTASNTYTGVTYFNSGTVSIAAVAAGSAASPLGQAANTASNLQFSGGTLSFTAAGATASTDRGATFNKVSTIEVVDSASTLTLDSGGAGINGVAPSVATGMMPGILRKTGAGALTLGGTANNANLSVQVVNGTLNLGKTSSSVSAVNQQQGVGLIIETGATAKLTGSGTNQINDYSSVLVKSGGTFDLNAKNEGFDGLAGGGLLTSTGAATVTLGTNNDTMISAYTLAAAYAGVGNTGLNQFTGTLGGDLSLVKTGAGTQILAPASTLTYTGTTTISAGTLKLGSANVLPISNTAPLAIAGNTAINTINTATAISAYFVPGTLDMGGYDQAINGLSSSTGGYVTNSPTLAPTGSGGVWSATVGTATGANAFFNDGTGSGSSGTGTNTLTINTNALAGTASFNGVLEDGFTTVPGTGTNNATGVYGKLALTKDGAGTQILSGASTYSGGTIVTNGTLLVNNSSGSGTGSGSVTVGSGATLGGSGIIGGSTTIQSAGILAPGNSAGTLNFSSGLTLADGSVFNWENNTVNTLGTAGIHWDVANVTGGTTSISSTASTGAKLKLMFTDALTSFSDTFWDSNRTWNFITGGVSGSNLFDTSNIAVFINSVQQGLTNIISGQGAFSTAVNGSDLELLWTPATGGSPEIAISEGGNIASGGSKGFGTVVVGANTSLTFTISNIGTADLNLTGTPKVAVSGDADFTVTAQPTTPVSSPTGTTTFTVQFAPTLSGARTATLTIANDDSDEGTFTINLTGSGTTHYDVWALGKGLTGLPGSATDPAFDADPDQDGIKNGLEWVLGGNPTQNDAPNIQPAVSVSGGSLIQTFNREETSISETALVIEYGSDLVAWPKSVTIGAASAPADGNGVVVTINTAATPDAVTVNIPTTGNALGGKLFARMKVTRVP